MRALAARLDLRPTKTLGQNFVIDPNTVRRLVRVAGVGVDDVVVEVGPGLGSLTLGLLETASRVVAVEIDLSLAQQLPLTVAERLPQRADLLEVAGLTPAERAASANVKPAGPFWAIRSSAACSSASFRLPWW